MVDALKKIAFRRFRKLETNLHDLNYLFWECTTRCNLNCLHCGSDCSNTSTLPDMPLQDFLQALDTIKNPAKNLIVVLTGGEPLLRKDLTECGREIRKRGMRWGLVTNGQLYDEIRQNELLNAGLGALTISLDGLEDSHNWLRNMPGSFAKVDKALSIAANAKRLNFDVVTCVNQRNLRELPEIKCYLQKKGVKAWRLFTIIPIGRAADHSELFLDKAQLKEMFEFIKASRKEAAMDVKFSCEGYTGSYELKVRDSFFFCRAGINIASVLADGSISACPNIDRSFSQGNIYQDNFYRVWQDRFLPFRDRSWTRKGKCAVCPDYRDCLGSGMHNWHGEKSEVLVCHRQV
ncbi:MAG: TIGR04133 family radical SAM/SPASM protein [Bacteroidetes bacterium]|nr:TIGR04133 family radical SAM/SPASM protein [Bacteroidota bacterium]